MVYGLNKFFFVSIFFFSLMVTICAEVDAQCCYKAAEILVLIKLHLL
jgi:hypothetical protein